MWGIFNQHFHGDWICTHRTSLLPCQLSNTVAKPTYATGEGFNYAVHQPWVYLAENFEANRRACPFEGLFDVAGGTTGFWYKRGKVSGGSVVVPCESSALAHNTWNQHHISRQKPKHIPFLDGLKVMCFHLHLARRYKLWPSPPCSLGLPFWGNLSRTCSKYTRWRLLLMQKPQKAAESTFFKQSANFMCLPIAGYEDATREIYTCFLKLCYRVAATVPPGLVSMWAI